MVFTRGEKNVSRIGAILIALITAALALVGCTSGLSSTSMSTISGPASGILSGAIVANPDLSQQRSENFDAGLHVLFNSSGITRWETVDVLEIDTPGATPRFTKAAPGMQCVIYADGLLLALPSFGKRKRVQYIPHGTQLSMGECTSDLVINKTA